MARYGPSPRLQQLRRSRWQAEFDQLADPRALFNRAWSAQIPVTSTTIPGANLQSLMTIPEGLPGLLVMRAPEVIGAKFRVKQSRDRDSLLHEYDVGPASYATCRTPPTGGVVEVLHGIAETRQVFSNGTLDLAVGTALNPRVFAYWRPLVDPVPTGQTIEWVYSGNTPPILRAGANLPAAVNTALGYPPLADCTVRAGANIRVQLQAPGGDVVWISAIGQLFEMKQVPPWALVSATVPGAATVPATFTWRDQN